MGEKFQPHHYADYLEQSGDYAREGGILFKWDGIRWEPQTGALAEERAYAWLVKNRKEHASDTNARAAVRASILHCPPLAPVRGDLLVPCENGYVRLDDGQLNLVKPIKEAGLRHVIKCYYDERSKGPTRFVEFLETVLPDAEVRNRVQEYAGYTLTADARYQRAQLWCGSGANGKGVLANIIQALHSSVSSVNLDDLEGFKLSALIGASLIFSDEAPKRHINQDVLKSLIAGENVLIDVKNKQPVTTRIVGKFLVLGNHIPSITDHSDGFWRRWDIVPFDVVIPERLRDADLASYIIANELSGVLSWALEGLVRLRKRGRFSPQLPLAMARRLEKAKTETSPVRAWIEEFSVKLSHDWISNKQDVYDHYSTWCKRNGIKPLASTMFGKEIGTYFDIEQSKPRVNGVQVRGINLKVEGIPRIR